MAGSSTNSLADVLYRSLEKHLEATTAAVNGDDAKAAVPTNIDGLRGVGEKAETIANHLDSKPVEGRSSESAAKRDVDPISEKTATAPPVETASGRKPKVTTDPVLSRYGEVIEKAADRYGVDGRLIYSVIMTESSGRADAVSPKGAKGLMQLLDGTAADMGVTDSLDVHQNIMGGTKYLRHLLDKFDGNTRLALAAYNAGPGTVSKYNGVPPYPETRKYITEVLARLHSAKKP
jgi:soluble lytic murein transglycosylase-like protein